MLPDGYTDVAPGKIAAVVTHLEMLERPSLRVPEQRSDLSVRRVREPTAEWYRDLYRRVGEGWLWFVRLRLQPQALEAIIRDASVEVHALVSGGRDEGLLELDFRTEGMCELAYFGVTPRLVGQGAGRFLMQHAIERAWARPIHRFWVHTCTFDHPGAVDFYLRSGFRAFKRQIEIADDPRLTGDYPRSAAAHVPIIGAQ
jgi:GNAT superfamily N-acetyltransferase